MVLESGAKVPQLTNCEAFKQSRVGQVEFQIHLKFVISDCVTDCDRAKKICNRCQERCFLTESLLFHPTSKLCSRRPYKSSCRKQPQGIPTGATSCVHGDQKKR